MVTNSEHPGVRKLPTSDEPDFIGEIHHSARPTD